MVHRARTSFLHSSLLLAFLSIVPQVYPLSFISFSVVRLHVVFGFPLFLFPSGVHLRATFVMSSDGLRRTWPSNLHFYWINKVSMSLVFVMLCRSLLEILFGQNIFIIYWYDNILLSIVHQLCYWKSNSVAIYNYLCNQCISPLLLWVRSDARCIQHNSVW